MISCGMQVEQEPLSEQWPTEAPPESPSEGQVFTNGCSSIRDPICNAAETQSAAETLAGRSVKYCNESDHTVWKMFHVAISTQAVVIPDTEVNWAPKSIC